MLTILKQKNSNVEWNPFRLIKLERYSQQEHYSVTGVFEDGKEMRYASSDNKDDMEEIYNNLSRSLVYLEGKEFDFEGDIHIIEKVSTEPLLIQTDKDNLMIDTKEMNVDFISVIDCVIHLFRGKLHRAYKFNSMKKISELVEIIKIV